MTWAGFLAASRSLSSAGRSGEASAAVKPTSAAWLAKHSDAELELLVCYYNEYLSGDRLFDSPSLEKARDELKGSTTDNRVGHMLGLFLCPH